MLCYAEPVVVHPGVLCWTSGCGSWCAMLWQWLWIMLCCNEPVVVNMCYSGVQVVHHVVLCWASSCELLCVMVSRRLRIRLCFAESTWFWIMVCYTNKWFWICCFILSQWLWIMLFFAEPVIVNHVLCWASGCESWCAMLNQCLWINVC